MAMRPKSTKSDLPSTHDVNRYLHNQCLDHLKSVKVEIEVSQIVMFPLGRRLTSIKATPGKISATADGWSADTTKQSFLGMTIHWISVDKETGKWTLRSEVVGFKGLSGAHLGDNLGRYFMGLCDRVSIIDKKKSKVEII